MIRFLIFIIISSIVLAIAFTQFKSISRNKKLIASVGVIVAAMIGILLQTVVSIYQSLLAIVGVALVASWLFMKELEKEQQKKHLLADKRRSNIPVNEKTAEPKTHIEDLQKSAVPVEINEPKTQIDTIPVKSYSMQSITPERKEP